MKIIVKYSFYAGFLFLKYSCFYAGFLFLALCLAGCADYNDRLYREGMARYQKMIAEGGPRAPATATSETKPYQNPRTKTFAVYDRYGRFQGTVKERGY